MSNRELLAFKDGIIDYDAIVPFYQICNKCTTLKGGGQVVIIRATPVAYESHTVKGCKHHSWTYCPGIVGNDKCRESSRQCACPNYYETSNFAKHKKAPVAKDSVAGKKRKGEGSHGDGEQSANESESPLKKQKTSSKPPVL
jgi:hypothetical protein